MFFKKHKTLILLLLFIVPINVFAYSDYIIASGDVVGIKIKTDGIIVAGTYEVNGVDPKDTTSLKKGDTIVKINDKKVVSTNDMVELINTCNCKQLDIDYKRNNKSYTTKLKLQKDNEGIKTGLYVKDTISGIGTLTFIDPQTKKFGVLGHEITNMDTKEIVKLTSGTIFDASITGIIKSERGNPGEKNAILFSDNIEGKILKNTKSGIFGDYEVNIDNNKLYKVAQPNEIKVGKATILTVLKNNEVEQFDINITSIKQTDDKLKNISFEITDKTLLEKTNGIVQGMSGSPIIQGNNIIGAVTHVVVDDPKKGYGIFITNMLEEAEKKGE